MVRRAFSKASCVLLLAVWSLAAAQSEPAVVLKVVESDAFGPFLADGEGRSLYLTLDDGPDAAGCDSACSAYWPAFTSEVEPEAMDGVDASLISLRENEGGETQVLYNGWPLYYFTHDRGPGTTRGQASADRWFLVSPEGAAVGLVSSPDSEGTQAADEAGAAESASGHAATDEPALAAVMTEGEAVYARVCAACHGPGGEGGVGARLIANPRLADAHSIADAVTNGLGYMPALGGQMTAVETAAVLTFIRNTWGNSYGEVPVEVTEGVRE